ncbi:helix-turn-helix transcriptional regulator [Thiohalorhabdus sp.]|uniref:helix-turn-helix transcriptional regulator n=1 Tax=Thiohalorhabdus sp. TaxID=3094134 RepID=UPI002FC3C740
MACRRAWAAAGTGNDPEAALRLARYVGPSPGFWMGLQGRCELEQARLRPGSDRGKGAGNTHRVF